MKEMILLMIPSDNIHLDACHMRLILGLAVRLDKRISINSTKNRHSNAVYDKQDTKSNWSNFDSTFPIHAEEQEPFNLKQDMGHTQNLH